MSDAIDGSHAGDRGTIMQRFTTIKLSCRALILSITIVSPCLSPVVTYATRAEWQAGGLPISGSSGPQGAPAVLADANGTYVAWLRSLGSADEVRLQRFTSAGNIEVGWPADGVLVRSSALPAGGIQNFGMTTDGSGGAIVVWDERLFNLQYDIFAQRIDANGTVGTGWMPTPTVVTGAVDGQFLAPTERLVVPDGSGGVYIGWHDRRQGIAGDYEAYLTHLDASGSLVSGWTVNGDRIGPALALSYPSFVGYPDGAGGILLGWVPRNWQDRGVFVHRLQSDGSPAPGWNPQSTAVDTLIDQKFHLRLTHDGSGGAVVMWVDTRGTHSALWISQVDGTGSLVSGVPMNGIQISNPGPAHYGLIPHAAGGAQIAWSVHRTNGPSGLYTSHFTNGAFDPGWPVGGLLVEGDSGGAEAPNVRAIADDGDGGFVFLTVADNIDACDEPWSLTTFRVRPEQVALDRFQVGVSNLVDQRSIAAAGNATYVAWSQGGTMRVQHLLHEDPTQTTWQDERVPVTTVVGDQKDPVVIADDSGGLIAAWHDAREPHAVDNVVATRLTHSGALAAGWAATGTTPVVSLDVQRSSALSLDGNGGVILAWTDERNGDEDVYAQRLTAAGSVESGWSPQGMPVVVATGAQRAVRMTSDGSGGVLCAWLDSRSGNFDLYVQRLTSSGAPLAGWPVNGVALTSNAFAEAGHSIVTDGQGGAFVVWEDVRNGAPDIYAHHVLSTGVLDANWPANGLAVTTANSTQYQAQAIADGSGGVLITWQDFRSFNWDIYASRLLSNGTLAAGWVADGNAVCSDLAYQIEPQLVADGAGGAFVGWLDNRSTFNEVFAHRILGDGTLAAGWTADGVRVSSHSSLQDNVRLAADGVGGVFAAWSDEISGVWQVYVQSLDDQGSVRPGWPSTGLALQPAPCDQFMSHLVTDGSQGALAVWEDYRNGHDVDLFAQRVRPWGVATDAASQLFRPSLSGFPNPFRDVIDIRFTLGSPMPVRIDIFDVRGRRVRTVVQRPFSAGSQVVRWDGFDGSGERVGTGAYFVRIDRGGRVEHRKVVRIR